MHMPGLGGWILIGLVVLIFFGPKKLPELGRAVGKTLYEFKNATSGLLKDDSDQEGKQQKASKPNEKESDIKSHSS
jgi:sec-independent protein translocase protein TatA